MIEINLLPESELKGRAKRRSSKKPATPGGGLATMAIFLFTATCMSAVSAVGYFSWTRVHDAKVKVQGLEADKRVVDAEIDKLADKAQEIRHLRQVFSNQWEILQSLDPPERVLWSEKVNMISDLIPSNIFLTKIELEENVVEVEIQSSIEARLKWEKGGKKGPRPPVVKKPVISYSFTLAGLATGADNVEQFNNVIEFHDALIEHEGIDAQGETRRFMDNFNPTIEFQSVEATLYEGVPVNKFAFLLRTRPISSEDRPSIETAGMSVGEPSA